MMTLQSPQHDLNPLFPPYLPPACLRHQVHPSPPTHPPHSSTHASHPSSRIQPAYSPISARPTFTPASTCPPDRTNERTIRTNTPFHLPTCSPPSRRLAPPPCLLSWWQVRGISSSYTGARLPIRRLASRAHSNSFAPFPPLTHSLMSPPWPLAICTTPPPARISHLEFSCGTLACKCCRERLLASARQVCAYTTAFYDFYVLVRRVRVVSTDVLSDNTYER